MAPQIDPPWRFDPLQNPVNVSWGGGPGFVTATGNFHGEGTVGHMFDKDGAVIGTFSNVGFEGTGADGLPLSITIESSAATSDGKFMFGGYNVNSVLSSYSGPTLIKEEPGGGSVWGSNNGVGGDATTISYVRSTNDGGCYSAYVSVSDGVVNEALQKFNKDGGLVWSRPAPPSGSQVFLCTTPNGKFVVFGQSPNLTCYDENGMVVWVQSVSFLAISIGAANDGFALIGGDRSGVSKYNIQTGGLVWSTGIDIGSAIDIARDGSVFVVTVSGADASLTKLDSKSGTTVWSISVPSTEDFGSVRGVVAPGGFVSVGIESQHLVSHEDLTTDTTYTVSTYDQATASLQWTYTYGHLPPEGGTQSTLESLGRSP